MLGQELEHRIVWGSAELPKQLEWRHFAVRETPWMRYDRRQGFLNGIPVEGAEAVAATLRDGRTSFSVVPLLPDVAAGGHPLAHDSNAVWLVRHNQWVAAMREELYQAHPLRRVLLWRDASGRIVDSLDLIRRFDSIIPAKVFLPDPLTVANVPYGGIYVDANDGNASVLDPLRSDVGLKVTWNGSGFVLANAAAVVQEFDPPTVAVPILTAPSANFSRSDAEFEMVNALYHIWAWKQRMGVLGYANMVTYAIPIDVNAYGGADQSAFDYGTNPPRLYFGEGGVDDAEDADVVVHEYGHAMAYGAAPGTNITTQRQALEEAICDYFAVAWSLEHSPNRWQDVFTWDGHNAFWSGRSAVNSTNKMYPGLVFTSPYSHTNVLVDALVRGRQRVGGGVMDGLVMEALYSLTASTTFRQFALAVLHADTVKHQGQHAAGLRLDFGRWNILEPGLGEARLARTSPTPMWVLNGPNWPVDVPEVLHLTDALGRSFVVRRWDALPAPGWYTEPRGIRVLVLP